jgi:AraC-like DNA-binding protein
MTAKRAAIPQLQYQPPKGYALDIEVFPLARIRREIPAAERSAPRRIEFWLLIYLHGPASRHVVDFEPLACPAGSVLLLRPGQVHRFDTSADAEGWMVPFQPEFLPSTPTVAVSRGASPQLAAAGDPLLALPVLSTLSAEEQSAMAEGLTRMHLDAQRRSPTYELHALLRHQLLAIITRLTIAHARREQRSQTAPTLLARYQRFRDLVELDFRAHRQVARYARRLGCSEKSLVRACWEVAGMSAKTVISSRITLEAKRLLAHTDLQVAEIADQLGFDEATNFVKFFRREASCSPGEFRKQQAVR